jgi:hypothetical protein
MSPKEQSESTDPADTDAPSEAEQIEQQLGGLAESRFARKKQELKASQEAAGSHMVGKLLDKVEGRGKSKAPDRQRTDTAASEGKAPQADVAPVPMVAQPIAVGKAVPVTAGLDAETLSEMIAPVLARLAQVESALEASHAAGRQSDKTTQQAIETLLANVSKQEVGISSIVQFLRKQAQAKAQPLAEAKAVTASAPAPTQQPVEANRPKSRLIPERKPVEAVIAVPVAAVPIATPAAVHSASGSGESWHQAIFGPQWAAHAKTAPSRQQLLDGVTAEKGVTAGKKDAATLAGLLMMFQAAAPDRRPQMLKDIGEAYLRWRPDANDDPDGMRAALVTWLTRHSEESGKSNTIELVHPGDRFDNTRHHAQEKGAEIVRAFGWVVLREGGKVYTKASVAVK